MTQYTIPHYEQMGYEWELSPIFRDALNSWLTYKAEQGFPLKQAVSVEMLISRLGQCCTTDAQKVTLIENAIAGGFASIKFEQPREYGKQTGNGQRKGHDIANIDGAADEVLRQYSMQQRQRGDE